MGTETSDRADVARFGGVANQPVSTQGLGGVSQTRRLPVLNSGGGCGSQRDYRQEVADFCQDDTDGATEYFKTGATRSKDVAFDPEGFISPIVLAEYSRYMEKHRVQADGKLRASDNWQKGMPTSRARRSLTRHMLDAWLIYRGYKPVSADCTCLRDALCGMLFNVMLLLKNDVEGENHE